MPEASPVSARPMVSRYWDQLGDVRTSTLAITSEYGRRASLGQASPGTAEAHFESFRQKMRQEKFGFIDAESKASLQQGLKDGHILADSGIDSSREDAKRQNKEIKCLILQEKEAQASLQEGLGEAVQAAQGAYDACVRELEELQMTQKEFSSELGGDLTDTGSLFEDLASSAQYAMNDQHLESGMNALMRVQSTLQEEKKKRQELEELSLRLEAELRERQQHSNAKKLEREQECKKVSDMEAVKLSERDFGILQITFDDAAGTVAISANGGSRVDLPEEELRTVQVEFDREGKLVRAMPHEKLNLQHEAIDAVQLDDLPRLLTAVWHQLCCSTETSKGYRRSRGGA